MTCEDILPMRTNSLKEGANMRISSKGRYALAAMTFMSRNYASGTLITIYL